jgi:outer membrane protein assembly factor BamB/tetratricopeptide (TPR) repeat protein
MSLQGQIEEMGLGACIQTLSLNRYRGTLRIESDEAGSQFFFISEGEIVLVRQVQRDPVRLGDLLVRAGKVTHVQLDEALRNQKKDGKRLGEVLCDMGLITQEDIDKVIKGKFEDEFLDLFLLDRGRFEFIFGLTPEALFAPEEKLERVTLNTSGLMLEAMRRLDEWQDMIKSIGSLDTIFQNRTASIGANITDYEFKGIHLPGKVRVELYEALDGSRSVREVLALAIRQRLASRMETFQYLHALTQNELIKPLDFRTLFNGAKSALEAGEVAAAAKYIRAILGQKGQLDVGLIKRYLTFLKKYKRPRLAFDEAKLFAAACLSRDETEHAIALYEEALALEFRNIEVVDRLFYALLRANNRARAVTVGLMVRDYLTGDEGLGVATRVANNLRELDPDNPEVIELSGLVLSRQERVEEAVKELERALERGGPEYPRRRELVAKLLELQPERTDLRDEREALEVKAARQQIQLEFRRRLLYYGVGVIVLFLVWRTYQEFQARSSLSAAQELVAGGLKDFESYGKASRLLQDAVRDGLTSVSGEARREKEKIDLEWATKLREADAERLAALAEARAAEETRRQEQVRLSRGLQFEDALAEHRRLVGIQDWAAASQKTLDIRERFGDLGDARCAELPVYATVTSTPPGAEVLDDGARAGQTPCTVPVPVGGKVRLTLHLRGFKVAEATVEGAGFKSQAVALEPGPSWRVALGRAPLPTIATWDEGVVVADDAGRVMSLGWADGRPRWSIDLSATLAPLGDQGVPFVLQALAASGKLAIVVSGQAMAAVELTTGEVEWTRKLSGAEARSVLVPAQLLTQDVVLLARGTSLVVIDASSGTPVQRFALAAPAAYPPVVAGTNAYVALESGALLALDLSKREGAVLWQRAGVAAKAPPIHSELAQAVLVNEGDSLRSFGLVDGAPLATLEPQLGKILGVALSNERLYVLGESGLLAALRAYDGQLLLRGTRVAKTPSGGPVVIDQDVVVVDADGELVQLTASARPRPGKLSLGGKVTAPLVVRGDRIVAVVGKEVLLIEPPEVQ